MNKLEAYFTKFGLSQNESKIYMVLLENGPSSVLELANRTQINRITVHVNVESMMKKGLVTFVKKGSKRKIIAEPPEKFKNVIEEEKINIQQKENSLKDMINLIYDSVSKVKDNTSSEVKIYEGRKEIALLYDRILLSKSIRAYADTKKLVSFFPENKEKFVDAVKRGVEIWDMHCFGSLEEPFITLSKLFTNYHSKSLPKDVDISSMDYLIYSGNIAIIHSAERPNAVVIKNEIFYQNSKALYDLLWRLI